MGSELDQTLWVGNLNDNVTEELLYELFLQSGPLEDVKIAKEKDTGKKKNFAFVRFKHACSVPYTIELMNGIRMHGNPLRLQTRPGSVHQENANQGNQGRQGSRGGGQVNRSFSSPQMGPPGVPQQGFGDRSMDRGRNANNAGMNGDRDRSRSRDGGDGGRFGGDGGRFDSRHRDSPPQRYEDRSRDSPSRREGNNQSDGRGRSDGYQQRDGGQGGQGGQQRDDGRSRRDSRGGGQYDRQHSEGASPSFNRQGGQHPGHGGQGSPLPGHGGQGGQGGRQGGQQYQQQQNDQWKMASQMLSQLGNMQATQRGRRAQEILTTYINWQ